VEVVKRISVPGKRLSDDDVEVVVLWGPAEFVADAVGAGDDLGRIAGPAGR
jgi:hypothetical protein